MIRMNNPKKNKLIIQFCHAERIKSAVLNMMQVVLRFHDYLENKKENPDGKTILLWFLNQLINDIARAANISQSQNLTAAQNLVAEVIQNASISEQPSKYQELVNTLRNALTKITSEAASVASELNF